MLLHRVTPGSGKREFGWIFDGADDIGRWTWVRKGWADGYRRLLLFDHNY